MTLHVSICVNQKPIGLLEIHNLDGNTQGLCDYEVVHREPDDARYATFTHNRRDGALACIRRAIEALEGASND